MSGNQTFNVKELRFTFTLSNNSQFNGPNNTLVVTGLRAAVDMSFPPPPSFPSVQGRIYGMLQSDMNALTALTQVVLTTQRNSVVIEANSGQGWSAVFAGQLVTTVPDYNDEPNVCLRFLALTLGFDLVNPATPTSYPAAADIATVISAICQKLSPPCTLVNSGVTGTYSGPVYFANTAAEQLRAAVKKAGIAVYQDPPASGLLVGIVEITPSGQPRSRPVFVLSPQTGLVATPSLDDVNIISARAVFNPALVYGGPVQIKGSNQVNANGTWQIVNIDHHLSSQLPDGPWFSDFRAQPPAGYKFGQ